MAALVAAIHDHPASRLSVLLQLLIHAEPRRTQRFATPCSLCLCRTRGDNAPLAPSPRQPYICTMPLKKRSFSLAGHRTSVALEPEFWAVLDAEARAAALSLAAYVARLDATRGERPLASALRLAALAATRTTT